MLVAGPGNPNFLPERCFEPIDFRALADPSAIERVADVFFRFPGDVGVK
jgi:hypothetical protein